MQGRNTKYKGTEMERRSLEVQGRDVGKHYQPEEVGQSLEGNVQKTGVHPGV